MGWQTQKNEWMDQLKALETQLLKMRTDDGSIVLDIDGMQVRFEQCLQAPEVPM